MSLNLQVSRLISVHEYLQTHTHRRPRYVQLKEMKMLLIPLPAPNLISNYIQNSGAQSLHHVESRTSIAQACILTLSFVFSLKYRLSHPPFTRDILLMIGDAGLKEG
jgi:hypothetical protein